jgi:hypothetical protein
MASQIITIVVVPATALFEGGQAYDLVDLPTVKDEFSIPAGVSDGFLQRAITQVSTEAGLFCNRVFPVETLLDQIWLQRDAYPQVVTGGLNPLQLSRWPITSVASLAGIAPPAAPVLAPVAGGAPPAANYFVRVTYLTKTGETPGSPEINLLVAANNLLQVLSPPLDTAGLATGWNVYVATASGKEFLQNTTPIAIGTAWTEPATGLLTQGTAISNAVAVVENSIPLAEGVDFQVDRTIGQLIRFDTNGWPRKWPALPITATYATGFTVVPPDLQKGVLKLIKLAVMSRDRDPALRQENIAGAYEAAYWFASGPGQATGDLPPDVEALLERYRVPVFG